MNVSQFLKAIAEPTRLRVIMLLRHGELCVCDLTATLELPQSTISRHIAVLRSAHVVTDRRSKKWVHYRLAESAIVIDILSALSSQLLLEEPFLGDHRKLQQHLAQKRYEEMGCGGS